MKLTVEVDDAILAEAMDITCAKSEEEAVRTSLHGISNQKFFQEAYFVSVEGLRKYLSPSTLAALPAAPSLCRAPHPSSRVPELRVAFLRNLFSQRQPSVCFMYRSVFLCPDSGCWAGDSGSWALSRGLRTTPGPYLYLQLFLKFTYR